MSDAKTITGKLRGHWHQHLNYGTALCPAHKDQDPSLSLADGKAGRLLVKCFAGCDALSILAALRRKGLLDERQPSTSSPSARPRVEKTNGLNLWGEAHDAAGSIVEVYLGRRAVALPPRHHEVIRFHPRCPFKGQKVPAMVALLRDVRTDEPCGIHRTPLLADGSDRDRALGKAMLGRAGNAVIKISPDDDVTMGLGVAEGIETALAIIGIGWTPVWAAGSAGTIAKFPVLSGIEELTLFTDRDEAGQRAARVCARRWGEAGLSVSIRLPLGDGADWCDVVRAT